MTLENIAQRADALKTVFVGLELSVIGLLHPNTPLLRGLAAVGMDPSQPVIVRRLDGTSHSEDSIADVLRRAPALAHQGEVRADLLLTGAMQGAVRLYDDLNEVGCIQRHRGVPLLQFARHFRHACAHGNRWHFRGAEPKYPAALRGRSLDRSLHGSPALFDWVGPGDYLDYLDDLSALLRGGTL
jgi:hypothetical protein